ncbi:coproporphyrinogen III oxidase [Colletotrichum graminicola]|nr:coproporphyrinogen III oxidase [Colletotrichum graminicola]
MPTSQDDQQLPMRTRMELFIRRKQQEIISKLENVDGTRFRTGEWERPDDGGGGRTCVLQDDKVFEKAGVNISIVHGKLNRAAIEEMRQNHKSLPSDDQELEFYALGLSMAVHPRNPMAPTVHMNGRYFETVRPDGSAQTAWFGGGSDLTPSYLFDDDAEHFHRTLKKADERRGIGGIFFDDLDEDCVDLEEGFAFAQSAIDALLPAYIPIAEKRKDMPFKDKEKEWQQIRRGRYVEFNLVHDRGMAFGLNVPGSRVESILISLPITAQWRYMHDEPNPDSPEGKLLEVLRKPKEWV